MTRADSNALLFWIEEVDVSNGTKSSAVWFQISLKMVLYTAEAHSEGAKAQISKLLVVEIVRRAAANRVDWCRTQSRLPLINLSPHLTTLHAKANIE